MNIYTKGACEQEDGVQDTRGISWLFLLPKTGSVGARANGIRFTIRGSG